MLDMTQSDLAKVIGLTFQQLQKYEKGTNRVSATTLQKLAATMKVPITYFFKGGSCENVADEEVELGFTSFLATPDGLALVTAFKSIESKSLRRAVVTLVEGMGRRDRLSTTGRRGAE
jgi:transcriptional regulator with XRE-family HTH domain